MRDQISSTIADVTKSVTDNYTETNERVLDAVVENSRKAVEFSVKTADQVNEQFDRIELPFELPFTDRVPTPTEAGDRYLELVDRIVEMNRDFSERIVKMNREYSDRIVEMLREEAPAKKPAAKKATAKKTTKKSATKVAKKTSTKATTKAASGE